MPGTVLDPFFDTAGLYSAELALSCYVSFFVSSRLRRTKPKIPQCALLRDKLTLYMPQSRTDWLLLTVAFAFASLCGWGTMHFIKPLFFLGFPGGMLFVMIDGVHGTSNAIQHGIAVVLYLMGNTVLYFLLLRLLIRILPNRPAESAD
jgi:hypothetical protein